ncbi:MurR/RpiR family transcriptional regulator [Bacillus sp. J14TS2]|uniref:MurR/RpiR family transcriptional regulator n=1 Tax=Bacillus sp. J14TS2 TaxID=2807188 RepID=UPI001BB3C487|nr:MurR/RpiR family transcriptional regulator [Bacillus sp. J14TS2]
MKTPQTIHPEVMISSIYHSLTKSEQKVADLLKTRMNDSVYWSVSDLAEYANVGETTVIRFCRKLGYKGYQDFKLAVAQNKVETNSQEFGEITESDSLEVLAQKITAENIATIQNTLKTIQQSEFEQAGKEIIQSNKLYLFGVGASGLMAQQAQYRFMRIGFNAESATDSHIIAMNSALAKKGEVIIGISTSGSTKDLVDALKIAKENGAFIICITKHFKSPITKFGDIVLLTSTKESPLHGGAFSSSISQMHVLDILTRYIEIQEKDRAIKALKKTAKAVSNKLY